MRARRPVEVDPEAARGNRYPIRHAAARSYDFGEPGIAVAGDEELRGVIAWDPELRWVLIVDDRRPAR